MLSHVARHLGLPAEQVRAQNFYGLDVSQPSAITHYDQPVRDNDLPELWWQLLRDSDYRARRDAITEFNAASTTRKRGLAIVFRSTRPNTTRRAHCCTSMPMAASSLTMAVPKWGRAYTPRC
jgi:hypothetical protein